VVFVYAFTLADASPFLAPAVTLSIPDRQRVAKMLELLNSDKIGERESAVFHVCQFLRKKKITFTELLLPVEMPPSAPPPPFQDQSEKLRFADFNRDLLTSWEDGFITDIQMRGRSLTEKQEAVLDRIVRKLWAAGRRP
jgi:hypothetical protein